VSLATAAGGAVSVLVVASQAGGSWAWAAFVNRCTHARWPLDRFDGQVLFDDTGALMCAAHFAVFDPLTGQCLGGPGNGRPLTNVPVGEDGEWLVIGPVPDGVPP
jgi:nitrite reductase/ring-hydroxylating ferredoxin subunit